MQGLGLLRFQRKLAIMPASGALSHACRDGYTIASTRAGVEWCSSRRSLKEPRRVRPCRDEYRRRAPPGHEGVARRRSYPVDVRSEEGRDWLSMTNLNFQEAPMF